VAESERGREYVRRFASTIELDEQIPEIRPGMTAGVEILIAELKDVLFVPIQAVQTHRGSSYCFVLTDNQPERREVVAGHSSNELVEIKEGLHEGELVLLAPPESNWTAVPRTRKNPPRHSRRRVTTRPSDAPRDAAQVRE
jgi:HlyD family secretion protein